MFPALLLPIALLACRAPSVATLEPDPGQVDPDTGSPPHADTGDDTGILETLSDADPADDPTAWIFDAGTVHEVTIHLSEEAMTSLTADPYTYVKGGVEFGDVTLEPVGIRIKGRVGSYRSLSQKSAFKLNFNHYDSAVSLSGLEKLNLNNMVQDDAQVHEYTAYRIYNALDLPAPRVGYAWVRVNDVDFGVYAVVEAYDDRFLQRHYEDPSGNLYDGDYVYWSDGSYTLIDFDTDTQDYFELDEGEDVGRADIHAITEALDRTAGTAAFWDEAGELVDLDFHARFWATEIWVGQYDGYTYNSNNYRVYFDPEDHRAEMFPWDHDWAFYASTPITSPTGRLSQACKAHTTCHEVFFEALEEVCETVDGLGLVAELDALTDLVNPYLAQDPRLETTVQSAISQQEALRSWLQTRSDTLRATSGL